MGYDLHITRREDWADTATPDITLDEWMAYVVNDKELELTKEIEIGAETQFHNSPGYCEWNAHPTKNDPNDRPWFAYRKGSINTKNPDVPIIRKMLQIASALNAKVQGDDGEFYTEESLGELKNLDEQIALVRQQNKKPWWKFW
ncbi:MAG TPA: hypothetical protein VFZ33_01590 [Chitinophagaceae bacterium]